MRTDNRNNEEDLRSSNPTDQKDAYSVYPTEKNGNKLALESESNQEAISEI